MKTIVIDITSLLFANFLSGIQRTVIEYTKRLIKNNYKVKIICHGAALAKYYIVSHDLFIQIYEAYNVKSNSVDVYSLPIFDLETIDESYIWLDIDSVWAVRSMPRGSLYKFLKEKKVSIISYIYDLLPIMFPQFCGKSNFIAYMLYLPYVIQYADAIFVSSDSVKNELRVLVDKMKLNKNIIAIPLGSNFAINNLKKGVSSSIIRATSQRFILYVGSLEPRKNHKYLLECFDKYLVNENINIVMAGRVDDLCECLYKKILKHPLYNKRIFFLKSPNNDEIAFLYKKAFAVVFPSYGEGFGLPIIESLFNECPVFASDIPIFKEVSKGYAKLFNLDDDKSLYNVILPYLRNKSSYDDLKNNIKNFKALSWDESFESLIDAIEKI